jgi:hypothetical protein
LTPSGVLINVNASLAKSRKMAVDITMIIGTIIQFITPTKKPVMPIIVNPNEIEVIVLKRL